MRNNNSLFSFVFLALAFSTAPLFAAALPSAAQFAITSIVVEGTNLILRAAIPSGPEQVVLETRSAPDEPWAEAGVLDVPAGGGEVAFTIPKPASAVATFRLKVKQGLETASLISAELQCVTMPSLGSSLADNGDAIFHFKGLVDGSDRIVITHEGALWNHVHWDWPADAVTINDTQWKPQDKNYLTTVGATKFLPEAFSLESVDLEVIQGRDVVALERTNNGVVVYLDDTPGGADVYEFNIHFHPVAQKPREAIASARATLKIAAQIDGSDCLKLTATEAVWEHKSWSCPAEVTLNDVHWSPQEGAVLKNEGTNIFLPAGIDFSTARIVSRKGRDLATMWADKDAVRVWFADNPNGDDAYELEISFGQ